MRNDGSMRPAGVVKRYKGIEVNSKGLSGQAIDACLLDCVVEYNPIPVPNTLLEEEYEHMLFSWRHQWQYAMLTGGAWCTAPCPSVDEVREEALKQVRLRLILKSIAEQEGIVVTQEELEAETAALAQRQGLPVEAVKGSFGADLFQLRQELLTEKVIRLIRESAIIRG